MPLYSPVLRAREARWPGTTSLLITRTSRVQYNSMSIVAGTGTICILFFPRKNSTNETKNKFFFSIFSLTNKFRKYSTAVTAPVLLWANCARPNIYFRNYQDLTTSTEPMRG